MKANQKSTSKERRAEIILFYEENRNMSYNDIAQRFGLTRNAVYFIIRNRKKARRPTKPNKIAPNKIVLPPAAPGIHSPEPPALLVGDFDPADRCAEIVAIADKMAELKSQSKGIPHLSKTKYTDKHGYEIVTEVAPKDIRDEYFVDTKKDPDDIGKWYNTCPSHKKVPEGSFPAMNDHFRSLIEESNRYKFIYGGRGSGKSHAAAMALVWIMSGRTHYYSAPIRVLLMRITKTSIKHSFLKLIEEVIVDFGLLHEFSIIQGQVKHIRTGSELFVRGVYGSKQIKEDLKGTHGVDIAVLEEADLMKEEDFNTLQPTLRKDDWEIWAIWNPSTKYQEIWLRMERMLEENLAIVISSTYLNNPYISKTFVQMAEAERRTNLKKYEHIYLGVPQESSEYNILADKVAIVGTGVIDVPEIDRTRQDDIYRGIDFGSKCAYSESIIENGKLYIIREITVNISRDRDDLLKDSALAVLTRKVYEHLTHIGNINNIDISEFRITGDSADNTGGAAIDYVFNNSGIVVVPAVKGPGSVPTSYASLQDLHKIYISESCPVAAAEFMHVEWAQDGYGQALRKIADKPISDGPGEGFNDHVVDSVRYAHEPFLLGFGKQEMKVTNFE